MLNTARLSFPNPSKSLVPSLSYAGRASSSMIPPTFPPPTQARPPIPRAHRFHTTPHWSDFHFDTHHFVQRLEREGLNRAQAEGIMSAMAEVIDESIRNMTSNMVTKADQEKVRAVCLPTCEDQLTDTRLLMRLADPVSTASLHTAGRLRTTQVGAAAH